MGGPAKFIVGLTVSVAFIVVSILLFLQGLIGTVILTIAIVASVLIMVPVMTLQGTRVDLDDDELRVRAPFVNMRLRYEDIDTLCMFDRMSIGVKTFGYSALHRHHGTFMNDMFGRYTVSADSRVPLYIYVTSGRTKFLFNLSTVEGTEEVYEGLRERLGFRKVVGEYTVSEGSRKAIRSYKRLVMGVVAIIVVVALVIVGIALFNGHADARLTDTSLVIDGTMMNESIDYGDITGVELRTGMDYGSRMIGVGNMKVLTGTFENGEFGRYVLAVNRSVSEAIVVHTSSGVYVFNLPDSGSTTELYRDLLQRL